MSQPLIDQLHSPEPSQRKQAIVALAKSADHQALQALADVYRTDPVLELRELALKAGRYIQQKAAQSPTVQSQLQAEIVPVRPMPKTAKPLPPKSRKKSDSGGRFIFWMLMIPVVLGLAYVVVVYVLPIAQRNVMSFSALDQVVRNTSELGMEYYVLRPFGEPPENGWPAVMLIHGQGGNGQDMVNAFGTALYTSGVLLIAPTMPIDAQGGTLYDDHLKGSVRNVIVTVQHDPQTRLDTRFGGPILGGFSMGAGISNFLLADYPDDFSGAMIMGLPTWVLETDALPANDDIPFRITVGEFDERRSAAEQYSRQIERRGNPTQFAVIEGAGHNLTQTEIDTLIALAREVYGLA